eukprot:jgi/Psemu1/7571/gm1.7571_g
MVAVPTRDKEEVYIEAIGDKYPPLHEERVWSAANGLKVDLQQSRNWAKQNLHYNGCRTSTFINSVFVFAPDGRIRICILNCPGSWHDSTMSDYGVYQKLESMYEKCGAKVVVGSAFKLVGKKFLIYYEWIVS